jgi:membrane protein
MNKGEFANLLYRTYVKWQKHDATLRAAALTFFTIMPLPSLALIVVAILAQIYGQQQALNQLIAQVTAFAGPAVANLLYDLLKNAQSPLTSLFGSLVAVVFALSGALGAFSVLQKSMDVIWEAKNAKRGRAAFMKEKMLPFALIIGMGLLVVVWTAFSTVLFNATVLVLHPLLGSYTSFLLRLLEIILSLILGALLFALIFKLLPETEIEWRDVWLAAFLTGIIFTLLNYVFGIYLSLVHVSTLAGTAGSLIVLFLWIYLVNLFILFGAQFSQVYAITHGSHKNQSKTIPKKPPCPAVDHIEVKTEIDIKIDQDKKD